MEQFFECLNTYIFGPSLPFVIMIIGTFLLFKYGAFIFLKPKTIVSVLTKKSDKKGISPIKSAMMALASTIGVGNIVGVATAIFSGGPGAVFWLTVSAFAAMSLKYGEVVLAMKYRTEKDGEFRGGAMYYMRDRLNNKRLSCIFAFLCIINAFAVGNMVQVKAVSETFSGLYNTDPIVLGAVGAAVVFFSIRKGTVRISKITSKIIPAITLVYIVLSMYVIIKNYTSVPTVIGKIIEGAFEPKALFGGVGGYTVMSALRYGVARGIMSNEAGSGTSPIAHAKSNLKSPAEQGFWGIFEVFADTVIMCNLTAFVILFSFDELVIEKGLNAMSLVLGSYGKYAGDLSGQIIAFSVLFFAFATVISQGFYGSECVLYLTDKRSMMNLYYVLFSLAVVYGSVAGDGLIWSITDLNISLMTVINSFCILALSGEIKNITDGYFKNKTR